jgi:hypothetical protein
VDPTSLYRATAKFYSLLEESKTEPSSVERFILPYAHERGSLLEVGSGTGELALSLVKQGVDVSCLEVSEAMSTVLFARLLDRPQEELDRLSIYTGSLKTFKSFRLFPLALASSVFLLIPSGDSWDEALRQLRRKLELGALLVADFPIVQRSRGDVAEHKVAERKIGAIRYEQFSNRRMMSPGLGIVRWNFRAFEGDQEIQSYREDFHVYYARPEVCRRALKAARFRITEEFGGFDRAPFDPASSQSLVVVAEAI